MKIKFLKIISFSLLCNADLAGFSPQALAHNWWDPPHFPDINSCYAWCDIKVAGIESLYFDGTCTQAPGAGYCEKYDDACNTSIGGKNPTTSSDCNNITDSAQKSYCEEAVVGWGVYRPYAQAILNGQNMPNPFQGWKCSPFAGVTGKCKKDCRSQH